MLILPENFHLKKKNPTKPKQQVTHKFRHFLLSRNKLGLLAALDAMMNEILLLGFASLLLLMVQKNVSGLCFAEGDYKMSTWLDSVDGCACCLSRTEGVSDCYLKARGCGSAAAMKACCAPLEGKGRTCDNPSYYEELLSAAGQSAAAAAAKALGGGGGGGLSSSSSSSSAAATPHRRLRSLLAASGGGAHGAAAGETTAESCAGRAAVGIGGCPPGKRPAVTVSALHEVHGEQRRPRFFFFFFFFFFFSTGEKISSIFFSVLDPKLFKKKKSSSSPWP